MSRTYMLSLGGTRVFHVVTEIALAIKIGNSLHLKFVCSTVICDLIFLACYHIWRSTLIQLAFMQTYFCSISKQVLSHLGLSLYGEERIGECQCIADTWQYNRVPCRARTLSAE